MILKYLDGHQKVLGQWLEDTSKYVTIYKQEPVCKRGLRFFLSNPQGALFLERDELRSYEYRSSSANIPNQTIVDADCSVSVWY